VRFCFSDVATAESAVRPFARSVITAEHVSCLSSSNELPGICYFSSVVALGKGTLGRKFPRSGGLVLRGQIIPKIRLLSGGGSKTLFPSNLDRGEGKCLESAVGLLIPRPS